MSSQCSVCGLCRQAHMEAIYDHSRRSRTKKFLRRPTMVADIYSTTLDQENSGSFNSILKVLGIIPGSLRKPLVIPYDMVVLFSDVLGEPNNLKRDTDRIPSDKIPS